MNSGTNSYPPNDNYGGEINSNEAAQASETTAPPNQHQRSYAIGEQIFPTDVRRFFQTNFFSMNRWNNEEAGTARSAQNSHQESVGSMPNFTQLISQFPPTVFLQNSLSKFSAIRWSNDTAKVEKEIPASLLQGYEERLLDMDTHNPLPAWNGFACSSNPMDTPTIQNDDSQYSPNYYGSELNSLSSCISMGSDLNRDVQEPYTYQDRMKHTPDEDEILLDEIRQREDTSLSNMENFSSDDFLMHSWNAEIHQAQQCSLFSNQEHLNPIEEYPILEEFQVHTADTNILPEVIPPSSECKSTASMSVENPSCDMSPEMSENESECRVCKSLIGNRHNYYGCIGICVSCRGFFRRSVQSSQFSDFVCNQTLDGLELGTCQVDSKSRRSCKRCRFDRCLKLGMKTNWVLTNEERRERLVRRNSRRQNAVKNANSNAPNRIETIRTLIPRFTTEEFGLTSCLAKVFADTMYEKYFAAFNDDVDSFVMFMRNSCEGKIFPFELVKKLESVDSKILNENGIRLLSFDNLSDEEQHALVRSNSNKLIGYLWALYCEPTDLMQFAQNLFRYGKRHPEDLGVAKVISALRKQKIGKKKFKYDYSIVYSTPWAPHVDIEERHYRMTKTISNWSRQASGKILDSMLMILYSMILLLSTEDTTLPEQLKAKVSVIQMKYITMLHRYLQATYPKQANTKFAGGLMLIQLAKELYDMHSLRLPF